MASSRRWKSPQSLCEDIARSEAFEIEIMPDYEVIPALSVLIRPVFGWISLCMRKVFLMWHISCSGWSKTEIPLSDEITCLIFSKIFPFHDVAGNEVFVTKSTIETNKGIGINLSVWYKTKCGSQNFGYQLWCLFCNISNASKIFSMWV